MPRHGPRRAKRPHDQPPEEESVDDLAVAAQFAQEAAAWGAGGADGQKADVDVSEESTDEESDDGSSDDGSDSGDEEEDDINSGDSDGKEAANANDAVAAAGDGAAAAPMGDNGGARTAKAEDPIDKHEGSDVHQPTPTASAALTALCAYDSDDDGDSDVDLAEQLARMEGEDDPSTTRKGPAGKNEKGPRTEHEIDPYSCPTDQLEQLNVGASIAESGKNAKSLQTGADGAIAVDANMKKNLTVAGTVRSHIAEQRTVVIDSFVPFHLQSQSCTNGHGNTNGVGSALDEGSLLVLLTKQIDGRQTAVSMAEADEGCSLQVLGKIMEVFGPVQRPLYAIRLPDPPKATENGNKEELDGGDPTRNADEIELEEDAEEKTKDEVGETAGGPTADAASPMLEDDNSKMKEEGESKEASDDLPAGTSDEDKSKALPEHDIDEAASKDPWSSDGILTSTLASCPNAPVYSLLDRATLIDTDQIIKVSGRGCDASNVYDEEAGPGELYFSDDEQERQAKRGNRKPRSVGNERGAVNGGRGGGGRGRGRGRGGGRGRGPPQHAPRQPPQWQQWQQPAPQPYQNQYPPSQMQQAHPHPSYAQGYPGYQQQGMYPQYPSQYPQGYSQQQYPPPPQAYSGGQPYQHATNGMQQHGQAYGVPPPPPPPGSGQYQQPMQNPQAVPDSDTVYYDFSGA
ncbi:hypothetical protein ACHAXT_008118 [Thalassiosira profunda]